jgi:hypothetical protein
MSEPTQESAATKSATTGGTDQGAGGSASTVSEAVSELERKIWFSSYIRTLVEQVGPGIFGEANRFRAFLMDQFPRDRREIRALHLAAEENVAEALRRAATDDRRLDMEARRQRNRLEEQMGLAPQLAAWTVEVLILAVRETKVIAQPVPAAGEPSAPQPNDGPAPDDQVSAPAEKHSEAVATDKDGGTVPVDEVRAAPPVDAVGLASAGVIAADPVAGSTAAPTADPPASSAPPADPPPDSPPLPKPDRPRWRAYALGLAGMAALLIAVFASRPRPTPRPPDQPSYQPFSPSQSPTSRPAIPPSLLVPNATYIGNRGWNSGDANICLGEYPGFRVEVSDRTIKFDSDGDTWKGSIDQQTGQVNISAGYGGKPEQSNLWIRGRAYKGNAEMGGGVNCTKGYFRFQ